MWTQKYSHRIADNDNLVMVWLCTVVVRHITVQLQTAGVCQVTNSLTMSWHHTPTNGAVMKKPAYTKQETFCQVIA